MTGSHHNRGKDIVRLGNKNTEDYSDSTKSEFFRSAQSLRTKSDHQARPRPWTARRAVSYVAGRMAEWQVDDNSDVDDESINMDDVVTGTSSELSRSNHGNADSLSSWGDLGFESSVKTESSGEASYDSWALLDADSERREARRYDPRPFPSHPGNEPKEHGNCFDPYGMSGAAAGESSKITLETSLLQIQRKQIRRLLQASSGKGSLLDQKEE